MFSSSFWQLVVCHRSLLFLPDYPDARALLDQPCLSCRVIVSKSNQMYEPRSVVESMAFVVREGRLCQQNSTRGPEVTFPPHSGVAEDGIICLKQFTAGNVGGGVQSRTGGLQC